MLSKYQIVIILDNLRSAENVGSIIRTAEGFGVQSIWMCGITPHPRVINDQRLPHVVDGAEKMLEKTALGALENIGVRYFKKAKEAVKEAKKLNFQVIALEQAAASVKLPEFEAPGYDIAIILGNEVDGLSPEILNQSDIILEIPMRGKKNSFNVSVALAIALTRISYR